MQQSGSLLLVDGDEARAERLAHRLGGMGFHVHLAHDGATGLLKAHELDPAAIVLTAELPVLDGYRMLDALRSRLETRDVPAILITDRASPEALARGWKAGADLCIPREQGEVDLLATLYRALGGLLPADSAAKPACDEDGEAVPVRCGAGKRPPQSEII
jgi:PleD family two-component response regulator